MRRDDICLYLSPDDRAELQFLVADRNTPRKLVWRSEIVLATADGHGTVEIMRRADTSKPTVWRWQERYLDDGVAGLKREAVAYLRAEHGLSERQACHIVGAFRTMVRYRSRRAPDKVLRGRLRNLANERRRFGYRRLFVLLRREGEPSGINRIYREEGLTVRKRKARRKAVGTRAPILVEARPNARWSLDFVHDQFASGQRFRVPNAVDGVTRDCLAAIPFANGPGPVAARWLPRDLWVPCSA